MTTCMSLRHWTDVSSRSEWIYFCFAPLDLLQQGGPAWVLVSGALLWKLVYGAGLDALAHHRRLGMSWWFALVAIGCVVGFHPWWARYRRPWSLVLQPPIFDVFEGWREIPFSISSRIHLQGVEHDAIFSDNRHPPFGRLPVVVVWLLFSRWEGWLEIMVGCRDRWGIRWWGASSLLYILPRLIMFWRTHHWGFLSAPERELIGRYGRTVFFVPRPRPCDLLWGGFFFQSIQSQEWERRKSLILVWSMSLYQEVLNGN